MAGHRAATPGGPLGRHGADPDRHGRRHAARPDAGAHRRAWLGLTGPAATGVLTGLALAIGFEGLPYIVLAGAAMALRFIFARDAAEALGPNANHALASNAAHALALDADRALARYGAWGAGSVAAAFLV